MLHQKVPCYTSTHTHIGKTDKKILGNAIRIKMLHEPSTENRKLYETDRKRAKYLYRKLQELEERFNPFIKKSSFIRLKMVVYQAIN